MRESKAISVNVTKERVIILVKLCIALCCHAGMTHDNIHVVGQVDLHFPSGQGTLVDAQTVVEVVRCRASVSATFSFRMRSMMQEPSTQPSAVPDAPSASSAHQA